MRSQKQMALLGLGGGVALASAAFAIGTQTGGGSAVAGTSAATTSTVTVAQTKRDDCRVGPRAGLADLAKRLGVEESRLRAAFEDLRPEPKDPDGHAADLAKILKLDEARVRAALEKVRPERGDGPGPGGHRHHRGGPGGPVSAELAKELGVSEEALDNAFETLHEQRRAEFAKQLAARLSISPGKVEEVLKELPHRGRRGPR